MFDKNEFKINFRKWLDANPNASYEEAKVFCESQIPLPSRENYTWLEEQSLAWFLWRKENQAKENLNIYYSEEEIENFIAKKRILL